MSIQRTLLIISLLIVFFFPQNASASPCWYGYCETFAYFDQNSHKILGYVYYDLWDYLLDVDLWIDYPELNETYVHAGPTWNTIYIPIEIDIGQVGNYWLYSDFYLWLYDWQVYDGTVSEYLYAPAPPLQVFRSKEEIIDGDTESFWLCWPYGDAVAFRWEFDYPRPAGNDPYVTFFSPFDSWTQTDGHWFAYPDDECLAGATSTYDIRGSVAFYPGEWSAAESNLRVYVPLRGGETEWPSLQGDVGVEWIGGLWRVVDNRFYRTAPTKLVYVPASSQFFNKINAHEDVHAYQMTQGMWASYWDPAELYNLVSGFTDTTREGLLAQVEAARIQYNAQQTAEAASLLPLAEQEAYSVSDGIAPRYFYQSCGRY